MATVIERLTKMKDELEAAKIDRAEIDGAIKQNMERLKTEFQCGSLERGKSKLNSLKEKKAKLDEEIEDAVTSLEKSYVW